MGDIIFTTPLVRALKKQTNAEIHFIVKKNFAQLLEHNPHIDKLIEFDGNLKQSISDLKREAYSHVIDLHNNLRSRIICLRLGLPSFRVKKLHFEKFMKIHFSEDRLPSNHVADRCFQAVAPLGISNDGKGMDFYLPSGLEIPETIASKSYIALVLGAAHFYKKNTLR